MKPKRYATIHHPSIQAVLSELHRYDSEQDAIDQLGILQSHFIVSKKQLNAPSHPSVMLWIKGYAVEEAEKEKGIAGHYALVSYKAVEGKFTLYATKIEVPLAEHPQRTLIMRDNPNWGHPVLRAIQKGKRYATLEEAQGELNVLSGHYPKVSIPTPGKLYIIIYSSNKPPKQRMAKHILEIKYDEAQQAYTIECTENNAKPAKRAIPPAGAEPQGKFTAQLAIKRQRRRLKPKGDDNS